MQDILDQINVLFAEHYGPEIIAKFGDEDPLFYAADDAEAPRFVAEGRLDSLERIEAVMALEDHFGIEILDHEAEKIETRRQMAELIHSKMAPA